MVAPGESASPGIEGTLNPILAPEGRRKPDLVLAPPPLRGSKTLFHLSQIPGLEDSPGATLRRPSGAHTPSSLHGHNP
jgi:hypothetical protein